MEIKQNLVSSSKYNIKCPYVMDKVEYITVHNTANDASAQNEVKYMISNNNEVSFHVAVDDKEAVQGIPFNRNTWACGDGANGTGNRKTINIEICYSKSGGDRFTKAEQNGAVIVAQLLKQYGLGTDRIRKHQDWNGKYCPHRTLDLGWDRFLNMVKQAYNGSTNTQPSTPSSNGQKVTLPASVEKWRVYPLNKAPIVGNECGYLFPSKFGGLTYDILRYTQTDVAVIKTRDYGEVQIYIAKNTGAIVNGSNNVGNGATSVPKTKKVYLPSSAEKWRVYPLNKQPVVGNECGFLFPKKFGGLTYDVLATPMNDVVTIQTRDYGKVNIYVASSTGAVIK